MGCTCNTQYYPAALPAHPNSHALSSDDVAKLWLMHDDLALIATNMDALLQVAASINPVTGRINLPVTTGSLLTVGGRYFSPSLGNVLQISS